MKKILSLILALMLLSFCACSNSEAASDPEPATEEPAEIVVVDNETLTFKVTGVDNDNEWGYILEVFIENKTDMDLSVSWDQVVVNGYLCDPFWGMVIPAGAKANEEIIFYEGEGTDMDANGLTPADVETIDFTLMVLENDNWEVDPIMQEQFSITPKTMCE